MDEIQYKRRRMSSKPASMHGGERYGPYQGTPQHHSRHVADRQATTVRCLGIVDKLQRQLHDPAGATVDVLLATNKAAVSELNTMLSLELRQHSETTSSQLSGFFGGSDAQERLDIAPIGIMMYVIALQYITDNYTQACRFFLTQSSSNAAYLPSSAGAGFGGYQNDYRAGGLPQLDFGSFKIDVADQRKFFGEIIGREMATASAVCLRVRDAVPNQLGSMTVRTGLLEETLSGIEARLKNLMEQVHI